MLWSCTLKAVDSKVAIYFFNHLTIRLKRQPVPGTIDLQIHKWYQEDS